MSEYEADGLNVRRGESTVGVQVTYARERKEDESMARQLVEVTYPGPTPAGIKRQFNVNDADFADFKKNNPSARVVEPRMRRESVTPAEIAASEPAAPTPSTSEKLDGLAAAVTALLEREPLGPTPNVSAQIAELTSAVTGLAGIVATLAEREPVMATLEMTAPDDVEDMTKPQLVAYAGEKGIDLGDAKTKAEILAVIQAAEGSASA